MSVKTIRENKRFIFVIGILAVMSLTAGAYADIGLTIKLAIWALKAELETEKWNWEIGGSLGTNTSLNWRCWTGGNCRCEPMLTVL